MGESGGGVGVNVIDNSVWNLGGGTVTQLILLWRSEIIIVKSLVFGGLAHLFAPMGGGEHFMPQERQQENKEKIGSRSPKAARSDHHNND